MTGSTILVTGAAGFRPLVLTRVQRDGVPASGSPTYANHAWIRDAPRYAGSGFPFVSGANQIITMPTI